MSAPADLAQQAAIDKGQAIDIGVASSLTEIDRAGKGYIDASDVRIAIHQMRLMRKALLFMAMFTVMLLIGMFASSYMAIQLSKDLSVQTGRLVDKKGHDVSTIGHVDVVTGISDASRRLAETGNPVSESEGVLKIGKTYFEKTLAGFSDGKIERVASLPDGSSRKVTILGSEGKVAWGLCGSWPYLVDWVASCPAEASTECVINYKTVTATPDSGDRRLHERAEAGTLGEVQEMQRALQSIKRPAYY